MTPYALWLSLLIALASLSSARGQDITIPITSPPAGASYTACTSCVPINWTSLVGSGDFTLDFNMWRAGTTYAPIVGSFGQPGGHNT